MNTEEQVKWLEDLAEVVRWIPICYGIADKIKGQTLEISELKQQKVNLPNYNWEFLVSEDDSDYEDLEGLEAVIAKEEEDKLSA